MLGLFVFLAAVAAPALAGHPYIIGGTVSKLGDWKWQGSLQWMFGDLHACGAAIVDQRWIVTAAHCVENSPFAYHLVAGLYDNDDWTQAEPQEVHFYGINKHPDFVRGRNDIAVIELSGKGVNMSSAYVETVLLAPSVVTDYAGRECYITGWGATSAGSSDASPLPMEAKVTILTNAECSEVWPDRIFDDHVCIASGQISTCNGDSGSPLVCKNAADQWELHGVASWGPEDCSLTKPSVFSRVTHFREWIDKVMQE